MKPAPYPNYTKEELDAITTFEGLINRQFVIPHINRFDKIPNTDGHIEIIDEEKYPVGKLEVQVRKIPDGATSYSCPVELVAYSRTISSPFLLICADVGGEKAYFRHLHHLMPELKEDQQTFTVKFDPKVHSISNETQYIRQWLEISQDYNKRISDYPRLNQIVNQLNPEHISKDDKIYFQEFIENINQFLDRDFPIVKEQYFKGVWKLGVAVSSADSNEVCFQLYTIAPGDTDIRVTGIAEHPEKPLNVPPEAVSSWIQGKPGSKTIQYSWKARSFLKAPKEEAEIFIFEHIQKMLRQKSFRLFGKRLAIEYLFWFVDRFGQSIGVEEADRLNVAQLNYGISVYLPAWGSIAVPKFLGKLIELNRHNLQAAAYGIAYPSFESIACVWPPTLRPAKEEVLHLINSGEALRPVQVCFHEVSPQMLMDAVDYLLSENQEWIERPYRPRSLRPSHIWSGFTADALRHNIRAILVDLLDDYRLFVERNRFQFKKSFYLNGFEAVIYVANLAEWSEATDSFNSPILTSYLVKNEDGKLPKLTLIDTSQSSEDLVVEKEQLKFHGLERTIIGQGGEVAADLFKDLPMLDRIYKMLKEDLGNEYGRNFL